MVARVQLVFICGGHGTRLPRAAGLPKCMVRFHGVPLLERLAARLLPLHDAPAPPLFVAAAGDPHVPALVRTLAPQATLLTQPLPDGVARAILLCHDLLHDPALVVLADTILEGTLELPLPAAPAVVVWPEAPAPATRANFGVALDGDVVRDVIEKPADAAGLACGTGLYLLTREVVARFAETPPDPDSGEHAITTALRCSLRGGVVWGVGTFRGTYVNVNGADDLARAEREIAP